MMMPQQVLFSPTAITLPGKQLRAGAGGRPSTASSQFEGDKPNADAQYLLNISQNYGIPKGVSEKMAIQDEKELKAGRIRATLWGGLMSPIAVVPLAWRFLTQNPSKRAEDRDDFLNEERSYANAIKHEKRLKKAQLVAGILPAAMGALWFTKHLAFAKFGLKNETLNKLLNWSPWIASGAQALEILAFDNAKAEAKKQLAAQNASTKQPAKG